MASETRQSMLYYMHFINNLCLGSNRAWKILTHLAESCGGSDKDKMMPEREVKLYINKCCKP